MKRNFDKEDYKDLLVLYKTANSEVELLKNYYNMSYSNLQKKQITTKEKYEVGIKIGSELDNILNKSKLRINKNVLDSTNNLILFENIKFSDIIKNIEVDKEEGCLLFVIDEKYKHNEAINPNVARKHIAEIKQYDLILFRSVLSDLIISFESILSRLLKILSLSNPAYLSNEVIHLNQFFIKDFAQTLISKIELFIENKMFNSWETLLDIIKIENIHIGNDILSSFKEIYNRRNIFTHNDGKVNKKYINAVDSKLLKDIKEGDILKCDQKYLENAFNIVTKLYFFIFYGVMTNYIANNEFIDELGDFAFDKLQNKDYVIAQTIYKTISENKKLEFKDKALYRINYLNAIKQLGQKDILNKELETLDVSIATDNFKIAKLCLQDNNPKIYELLSMTYPNSFTAIQIKEWPLFIDFRKSSEYSKFCKEHSEDFLNEKLINNISEIV